MDTEIDLVDTTCLSALIWRASFGVLPSRRPPIYRGYHAPYIARIFPPLSMPQNLVDTSHVNYHEHRTKLPSAIFVLPPEVIDGRPPSTF